MPDGQSALVHARVFARRFPALGAAALRELTPAPAPLCAHAAVTCFETLSTTRSYGMGGPRAITLPDIEAYSRMVEPLTPRDVRWVLAQDAAFVSECAATSEVTS